jgi:uncharacterized flavoprotein (TIGR03862 family)
MMAATQLLMGPHAKNVHLFEKRPSLGRKLLIAGSSGLNISHELTPSDFAGHYEGFSSEYWLKLLGDFGPKDWIRFIETELKLETFLGTSHRYFVKEMKASGLLKSWTEFLKTRGVTIHSNCELVDFESDAVQVRLKFSGPHPSEFTNFSADRAIFALGGASWETEEPAWARRFESKGIEMVPFAASNVGYEVDWHPKFLAEAEGKPLKKVILKTKRGEKLGELVVTQYGLEGTPIYFCGETGDATLDLKPDLSAAEIVARLSKVKENLSPMRRVKHYLTLGEASESLIFHFAPESVKSDLKQLAEFIKNLPLKLKQPRPLSEAISSRGGVALHEVTSGLELKKYKRIFAIGEMLAWDAPTGGFLIQAAVSQGASVGKSLKERES